jgi:hypothetical protein
MACREHHDTELLATYQLIFCCFKPIKCYERMQSFFECPLAIIQHVPNTFRILHYRCIAHQRFSIKIIFLFAFYSVGCRIYTLKSNPCLRILHVKHNHHCGIITSNSPDPWLLTSSLQRYYSLSHTARTTFLTCLSRH